MTLPTHSTPAEPVGSTTAVSRREYWFGLPAVRTSARAARDTVRHRLRAWQVTGATCGDAVLLVSELTTNAVLHTDSEEVLCGLTLTGGEQRLRIELHDEGRTPVRPPEQRADSWDESGRGLFLVQELADRWGSARSAWAEGTVVWAELTAAPGWRQTAR
ncbi:ATP-binding protein [Streptomyces sp. NPDC054855]